MLRIQTTLNDFNEIQTRKTFYLVEDCQLKMGLMLPQLDLTAADVSCTK